MSIEKVLYRIVKTIVSFYIRIMLGVHVEKITQIPKGARIFAVNHPSNSDAFFIAGLLPTRSYILITEEAFQTTVGGALLRKLGHIPVKEGTGQEVVDRAVNLLRRGETVVIFPEGEKSPMGGFLKAHTGVARLALASGAPVIPVGLHIKNEKHTRRGDAREIKEKHNGWYIRGPYFVTVGEPLHFHGNVEDRELVRNISNSVMHAIIELARTSKHRMDTVPRLLLPRQVQI